VKLAKNYTINSASMDFWTLGGLSIVVYVLFATLGLAGNSSTSISTRIYQVPIFFSFLSLIINYPHFMQSYAYAYGQGMPFIKKNWFQLLWVPFALVFFLYLGWQFFYYPIDGYTNLTEKITTPLHNAGLTLPVGKFPFLGQEIINIMINLMFLSVGWHYCKQIFGCMMVYARGEKYSITNNQRSILKWSLLALWFVNYTYGYSQAFVVNFFDFKYFSIGLADWLRYSLFAFYAIMSCLFLYEFMFKPFRENRALASLNFFVPWLAITVWFLPPIRNNLFYMQAVPFFHSLQYLTFCYRVNNSTHQENTFLGIKTMHWSFIWMCVIGFLAFDGIPELFDKMFASKENLKFIYWTVGFNLFINIHHYFIDNVIWRGGESKIPGKLF
jgi:hypothetical protein